MRYAVAFGSLPRSWFQTVISAPFCPGLRDELLRLREVVRVEVVLLVLRVGRRKDVLRRLAETAVDAHERLTVDRVVDGLPHLQVVERRDAVVHEEVVRVRRRVDLDLIPYFCCVDARRSGGIWWKS